MQSSVVVDRQRHEKQAGPLRQLQLAGQELLKIPLEQRYASGQNQADELAQDTSRSPYVQLPQYLFNVLVALEWEPTEQERQELAEAFTNASRFLYNVTDSCMALGQVVLGGRELMPCADIQIMASNRFNPRSWVDGLRDPVKYTPIRVGRGLWHKNDRTTLAWNKQKSFRTLIHEWAHYALGLKDEYIKSKSVVLAHALDPKHPSKHLLVEQAVMYQVAGGEIGADQAKLVAVPTIGVPNGSLMESVSGNELVPLDDPDQQERYDRVWETITARYPDVQPSGRLNTREGTPPTTLDILFVKRGAGSGTLLLEQWTAAETTASRQEQEFLLMPPANVEAEHCWIYVVKGDIAARPEQIIAQGTFDAASSNRGFKLLNAAVDDWLLVIGSDQDGEPIVLQGRIVGAEAQHTHGNHTAIVDWSNVTPEDFPAVDVIALPCQADEATSKIAIQIHRAAEPTQVWLFPLGQQLDNPELTSAEYAAGLWTSHACAIASLDGHVLMRWNDGTLSICTYSQGGGPATHVAARYSPVTAGSAEGNVMIFFNDQRQSSSNTRVVTTLLHGSFGYVQNALTPGSYVFSLTSNGPLPADLDPTLIMYFDAHTANEAAGGDLIIHRLDADHWSPMPTYVSSSSESSFAAMPMNRETAAKLFGDGSSPQIEHYRIFQVPRTSPATAT